METSFSNNILAQLSSVNCDGLTFLNEVNKAFNGVSFSTLMEAGLDKMIYQCLSERYTFERGVLNKMLLLINELLPELPHDLQDIQFVHKQYPKSYFMIRDEPNIVEQLIATIIDVVVVKFCKHCATLSLAYLNSVFYKMLYFASSAKLSEVLLKHSSEILKSITTLLKPLCLAKSSVALKVIMMMKMRNPEYCVNSILTIENIIEIKRMCQVSSTAQQLDSAYQLENVLNTNSTWSSLQEVCQGLTNGDTIKATEILLRLMESGLTESEFFYSNLIRDMNSFFFQNINDKKDNRIKIFLNILLKFSWNTQHDYKYDVTFFRKLMFCVKTIFVEISENRCAPCPQSLDCGLYGINILKETTGLLEYLHVLSDTWFHWFDIASANPLLDKSEFHIHIGSIVSLQKLKSLKNRLLKELANICPVILPFEDRKELFLVNNPEPDNHDEPLYITRENVLEQFWEISKNWTPKKFQQKWKFLILGEVGSGYGVFKELFSLLFKEFQRYDFNMWYGEQVKEQDSDGKSLPSYIYSPNGLFPKNANSAQKFFVLGQLLAKAMFSKLSVDIPLGVEFFKCLIPDHYEKIIHKYYDIAKILPDMGKVIKQILEVKRIKTSIMSCATLTEVEKQEKIGNLMFEEGCSFEDLCLTFTMPGSGEELREGGRDIILNPFNIEEYLDCIGNIVSDIVHSANVQELRRGFNGVYSLSVLSAFSPEELQAIICGQEYEQWTVKYLKKCIQFRDESSKGFGFLLKVLSTFTATEQSMFVQFVTGMPNLPCGGLQFLNPRLKVEIAIGSNNKTLPSSRTCFNLLYLPLYSSLEITREKLLIAITHGRNRFEFS